MRALLLALGTCSIGPVCRCSPCRMAIAPRARRSASRSSRSSSSRKGSVVNDACGDQADRDARRRSAVGPVGARDDRAPDEPQPLRGRAGVQRAGAGGVRVKYVLIPQHPIDRVAVHRHARRCPKTTCAASSPSASATRPAPTRKDEVAEALRLEYRRRGYPPARVTRAYRRLPQPGSRHARARRRCPAPRARILDVRTTQVDATERSTITDLPGIRAGQTYDEVEIGRELQAWENRMREPRVLRSPRHPELQHLGRRLGVRVPEPRAGPAW